MFTTVFLKPRFTESAQFWPNRAVRDQIIDLCNIMKYNGILLDNERREKTRAESSLTDFVIHC